MNSSKLIIAIIVIMVIGFSIIGYSMLSLYSEVQKEVINLNSTILHASNETQTGLSNKIANLANEIGFLESKVNNLNSSAYSSINSLQKQLNQLVYQLNFPVTIIDATNTSVTIPSYPERIISLDPA
ncbi:MAG: hypothetical protein RAK17_05350, partial [Caldisphaera sp.]|nr:hypothetical protein [Caldisphaera sp.]